MFGQEIAQVQESVSQDATYPGTMTYDELLQVCHRLRAENEMYQKQQAQQETQLRILAVQFAMGCAGDVGIPRDPDEVLDNAKIFLAFMQQPRTQER